MDQGPVLIGPVIKRASRYIINGEPIAQVRHSVSLRSGKPKAYYKSKKFIKGKEHICNSIRLQHWSKSENIYLPKSVPVSLNFLFVFKRPQRLKTKKTDPGFIPHTVKPDNDNLIKLYVDCLSGVAFHDDNQVYEIKSKKVFCSYDPSTKTEGFEGVIITVDYIDNDITQKAIEDFIPW